MEPMALNTNMLYSQQGPVTKCSATAHMNHSGLSTAPNPTQASPKAFGQMISHFNPTPPGGFFTVQPVQSNSIFPRLFFHLKTSKSLHFFALHLQIFPIYFSFSRTIKKLSEKCR